jgi:hypothetical protein
MKKTNKLVLKKVTLRTLDEGQLSGMAGGTYSNGRISCPYFVTCFSCSPTCSETCFGNNCVTTPYYTC